MKESFIFYASFYKAIEELDEKKQLKLYKSIMKLALENEENEKLTGIEKAIFELIKPQILANNKRYEDGQKGGRPKKNKTTGFEKEKTTGFENKKPNVNVNVNDNENENVNVNVNAEGFEKTKKQDPYINPIKTFFISEYQKTFNTRPYLSGQDCLRLTELASEYPDIRDIIPVAISRLKKISFDDINFKPTASWLLKSNNFERVMNGEFDTEEDNSWLDDWVKEGA
jgi:hypothetical protein